MRTVFVERKTHREDWWGDGDASAKERFPLAEDQVMPFLQGRLSPDEVSSPPHASPHASPHAPLVACGLSVACTHF